MGKEKLKKKTENRLIKKKVVCLIQMARSLRRTFDEIAPDLAAMNRDASSKAIRTHRKALTSSSALSEGSKRVLLQSATNRSQCNSKLLVQFDLDWLVLGLVLGLVTCLVLGLVLSPKLFQALSGRSADERNANQSVWFGLIKLSPNDSFFFSFFFSFPPTQVHSLCD